MATRQKMLTSTCSDFPILLIICGRLEDKLRPQQKRSCSFLAAQMLISNKKVSFWAGQHWNANCCGAAIKLLLQKTCFFINFMEFLIPRNIFHSNRSFIRKLQTRLMAPWFLPAHKTVLCLFGHYFVFDKPSTAITSVFCCSNSLGWCHSTAKALYYCGAPSWGHLQNTAERNTEQSC